MDAFIFSLSLEKRTVGIAVVAPAARFCSVLWNGATKPDRRLLKAPSWRAIMSAVETGIVPGLLKPSAVTHAIAGSPGPTVTLNRIVAVDVAPADVAGALDGLLRTPA